MGDTQPGLGTPDPAPFRFRTLPMEIQDNVISQLFQGLDTQADREIRRKARAALLLADKKAYQDYSVLFYRDSLFKVEQVKCNDGLEAMLKHQFSEHCLNNIRHLNLLWHWLGRSDWPGDRTLNGFSKVIMRALWFIADTEEMPLLETVEFQFERRDFELCLPFWGSSGADQAQLEALIRFNAASMLFDAVPAVAVGSIRAHYHRYQLTPFVVVRKDLPEGVVKLTMEDKTPVDTAPILGAGVRIENIRES